MQHLSSFCSVRTEPAGYTGLQVNNLITGVITLAMGLADWAVSCKAPVDDMITSGRAADDAKRNVRHCMMLTPLAA